MAGALNIGGSFLGMYSEAQQSENEAKAAHNRAYLQRLEAQEILERARINSEALRKEGLAFEGKQKSAYARGGVDIKGSPLLVLEETRAQFNEEIALLNRQAQFEAGQRERAASILTEEGEEIRRGTFLRMLTVGMGGAAAATRSSARNDRGDI